MNNRIFICAAVILSLALIGLIAYDNLEIYERKRYTYRSGEVWDNSYYAMENWLKKTGHPVRNENHFNSEKIAAAPERVIMAYSSDCDWENAGEIILPWIEQGGYLVLFISYYDYMDEYLPEFLSSLGIGIEEFKLDDNWVFDQAEFADNFPDFHEDIYFSCNNEAEIFTIKDHRGNARLVEIPIGEGAFTVTGRPRFMYNDNLKNETNASLAWNLTGARANEKNTGVVFVQDREEKYISNSLFGKIMDRGNFVPVGISALLVIFIGFWTVVPVFGLVVFDKPKTSRPIRERFLAEIRFLKKYKTLYHYLDVYNREQKIEEDPERVKKYSYRELINHYRRIFDGTAKF